MDVAFLMLAVDYILGSGMPGHGASHQLTDPFLPPRMWTRLATLTVELPNITQ